MARLFSAFLCLSLTALTALAADPPLPKVAANGNRVPAGTLTSGVLELRLEIREAEWFPEAEPGPSLRVFAFAEEGLAPQVPGPLIRVRAGATIRCTVRNPLDRAVTVHGLHSRPGPAQALVVPPGELRELTFTASEPGTYAYWASAGGEMWEGLPLKDDSQLAGAFIVDPAEGSPADRVLVLGAWRDKPRPTESLDITTINGKSWPHTERLTYKEGERIRWRVLNLTTLSHPMHLHGGYFDVVGTGDGTAYERLGSDARRRAATELMSTGQVRDLEWVADRPGRWLFHCHILAHITPMIMLFHQDKEPPPAHHSTDPARHMLGLVLGITVEPRAAAGETARAPRRRVLRLLVDRSGPGALGYALEDPALGTRTPVTGPGPTIVLRRGEPVEIRVVNRLAEPTSVHWHGIELDSYYDGVPGWTGMGPRVTPPILPGKSFSALFTPPRAGTFIYHTHMNDVEQMSGGLYGGLIVLEPGQTYRPETDRIFVIGHNGRRVVDGKLLLNGSPSPPTLALAPNTTYRLRFINISPNATTVLSLLSEGKPVQWRHVAKDGADLPPQQAIFKPASLPIGVGETYDFEYRTGTQPLLLKLSIPVANQQVQQVIETRGAAQTAAR